MSTIESALGSQDECTRIMVDRIVIKSGLRNPEIERRLSSAVQGESAIAAAWRAQARVDLGLNFEAVFGRIVPRGTSATPLPTDPDALHRLRLEADRLPKTSGVPALWRMNAVEALAKYVPREIASDPSIEFLGEPLANMQHLMAEAAMNYAIELLKNCYWGPPFQPEIVAEIQRLQHIVVPVAAGEWLRATINFDGGYSETIWNVYGPLLAQVGANGPSLLAIGGDAHWLDPAHHIQWCCFNKDAAQMLLPCLIGIWRTEVVPSWAHQEEWDDWSNPFDPSFKSAPSWIAKLVSATGSSAAPYMRPGLDDTLAIVRMRSCAAFEFMGIADDATTKRITAMLDDPDLWVRFFAAKALRVLAGENGNLNARAEDLLRNY